MQNHRRDLSFADPDSWIPTECQAKVIEVARQSLGLKRSISSILHEADVAQCTFYNWMKEDPGFKKFWEELPKAIIGHHMPGVVMAMIHKAQEGDVPAARLLAEVGGYIKQPVAVQNTLTLEQLILDADKLTDEDLSQILQKAKDRNTPVIINHEPPNIVGPTETVTTGEEAGNVDSSA